MKSNISEYDLRQLKLMYQNIVLFENKKIGLHSLVASLEFLFHALEIVEDAWGEEFSDKVSNLEAINAVFIIKEEENNEVIKISKSESDLIIDEAVSKLKILIEKKLLG
jgi:hypothetical protein